MHGENVFYTGELSNISLIYLRMSKKGSYESPYIVIGNIVDILMRKAPKHIRY